REDIKKGVQDLVEMLSSIGDVANVDGVAEFAEATVRVVEQGLSPTVRVRLTETGDDSYHLTADVGFGLRHLKKETASEETAGETAEKVADESIAGSFDPSTEVRPLDLNFSGPLDLHPFVGREIVEQFYHLNQVEVTKHWQLDRQDEAFDTL